LYANTSPDKKKHDKIKLKNIIWTDLFCFIKTSPFIQNRLAKLYSGYPIYNINRFELQGSGKIVEREFVGVINIYSQEKIIGDG